jgi:hypothetical protein
VNVEETAVEAGTEGGPGRRAPSTGDGDTGSVDTTRAGWIAVWWALLGLVLTFATAVFRLADRGIATVRGGLEPAEWLALAVLMGLFIYGEGVRGLQRRWIPAVLRRVAELRTERRRSIQLLAPLYAMLLVGAPRRTLWRAWLGVAAIVAAVFIVRALPEPWRGMTDLAVSAALGWGLLVILAGAWRLVARRSP